MPNLYGYAGLVYRVNNHIHQSIVQLQVGTSPIEDVVNIVAELDTLAGALASVSCNNTAWEGWKVFNSEHVLLYEGLLPDPVAGEVVVDAAHPGYNSATCTITGKGSPVAVGVPGGNAMLRWVCSGALGQLVAALSIGIASDPFLSTVAATLESSRYIWADYYGQLPTVRSQARFQFNAALQKRLGG